MVLSVKKSKVNNKKKKKQIKTHFRKLSVAKFGGFLPALAVLGALGSLAGGTASIVKTVNSISNNAKKLAEIQRHNKVMVSHGLFLKPYKTGKGYNNKNKNKKK